MVCPIISVQCPEEASPANPKGDEFHRWAENPQFCCENFLESTCGLWIPLGEIQLHYPEIVHIHQATMNFFALQVRIILLMTKPADDRYELTWRDGNESTPT